jgi:dephospho-CoA kinase
VTESESDTESTAKSDIKTLVVGLTGGIGSGKSTVAHRFQALGVPVIDADELARQLVEPGQPALDEIISTFGSAAITAEGRLDRKYMRQRIFADPRQRAQLEAILHPRIRLRIKALLADIRAPYCIIVIPLLLEARQTDLVDRILVVDSPEKEQLRRVAARDGLSDNAVMAIIKSQTDRNTRLAAADDIIVNDRDMSRLDGQIQKLHRRYTGISHDQ